MSKDNARGLSIGRSDSRATLDIDIDIVGEAALAASPASNAG
jgi:hypothetical protein